LQTSLAMMPAMNFPRIVPVAWREQASHLLDTLQNWPWVETLKTLFQRFREDRLGVTASSLTFTTLISLVPLVTVMLAIFSAFPMFASFQRALEAYFLQSLVPDTIARPVLTTLTQFARSANRLGVFGLVFLLVTALALMLTIDRSLNAIWRVRRARPLAQRVLIYWAALTLGPLLVGVSLTMSSYALSAAQGFVSQMPGGVSFLLQVLEFGMLVAGVAGLYHYVPNTEVQWRHAFAGGLFVAIGVEIAKRLLAFYLGRVPAYEVIYGAFATLPIFLVWLYLVWVVVLLGAVIAAYAPSLQMRVVRIRETPGSRFELALAILRLLALAREGRTHGITASELSTALRTDPLQIEPILESLVMLDWVGRLEEEGGGRHVLLCDTASTSAAPLLSQLLLDPNPVTRGFWQRAGFEGMSLADLIAE